MARTSETVLVVDDLKSQLECIAKNLVYEVGVRSGGDACTTPGIVLVCV